MQCVDTSYMMEMNSKGIHWSVDLMEISFILFDKNSMIRTCYKHHTCKSRENYFLINFAINDAL